VLTDADRAYMTAGLRAIRDDRPVSIVIRSGSTTLAAQTVRIARGGNVQAGSVDVAGVQGAIVPVVVVGDAALNIRPQDRFTVGGILYEVTAIHPNRDHGGAGAGEDGALVAKAASKAGIRWQRPPSELATAMERYGDRVLTTVAAIAQYSATQMQNDAKANATWVDRTGNARTGLFGTSEADFAAKVVTIYLSHGVGLDYGLWLEIAASGKWGIVMKTMQSHYEPLMQMLREAFA